MDLRYFYDIELHTTVLRHYLNLVNFIFLFNKFTKGTLASC